MKKYKNILNDIINIIYAKKKEKRGRKNKFDNYFYLNYIFRILFYGEYWNTFECKLCDRTTIRKKFYKWKDDGVFKIAYDELFKKYARRRTFKHLFVDSTVIQNFNCSNGDIIDYYYKIVSKKQTKISVICDSNKIPLVHKITNPKKHDLTVCKQIIKQIPVNLKTKSKLIGDKGYVTKKQIFQHKYKNIKIIYPYRKNQRKKRNDKDKQLLKKRTIIECLFGQLKNSYKRIRTIYDRNISNYNTFLLMAFSCHLIRFMFNKLT